MFCVGVYVIAFVVRSIRCCFSAILKVVALGVILLSGRSFHVLGRAKYGSFLTCSVLARGMYVS